MLNIDFNKDYTLENDKVLLRPISIKDVDNLLYFAEKEADIWRYSLLQPNNKKSLERYIEIALTDRLKGKSYIFIVFDKQKNKYKKGSSFFSSYNVFIK